MSNFFSNWIKLILICEVFCLIQSSSVRQYIFYGDDAEPGQFPYQVALEAFGRFACGGVLIKSDVVLTAGHCLRHGNRYFMKVRAGSIYLHRGGKVQRVCQAIVHPNYSLTVQTNDIAILKLCRPFKLSHYINPVPLINSEPQGDLKGTITGWGRTEYRTLSNNLKYTNITVKSREYCNRFMHMRESDICAEGTNGKSPCYGDSGGPLTVDGKLAGITSRGWGICGNTRTPNLYANVAYFKDFIGKYVDL